MIPLLLKLTLNHPMSSPQMIRMLGFVGCGICLPLSNFTPRRGPGRPAVWAGTLTTARRCRDPRQSLPGRRAETMQIRQQEIVDELASQSQARAPGTSPGASDRRKSKFCRVLIPDVDDTLPRASRILAPDGHRFTELDSSRAGRIGRRHAISLDDVSDVPVVGHAGLLGLP